MISLTAKQAVELFHLVLLSHLGRKIDKQNWSLKGGCNLRFFFGSPRYSDDMDLDVRDLPVDVLRAKVNAILSGKPFQTILATRGVSVEHVTVHKQTETTQRWKFGLTVPQLDRPVPTKVEFSRRGLEQGSVFEPVSPDIIRLYELPPVMANHYPAQVVWRQKIRAILSRTETQARDVFDLVLLLDSGRLTKDLIADTKQDLDKVRETVLSVDYGQFKSQVVSYLEPDTQPQYETEDGWDEMRWRLIGALGEGWP